MTYILLLSIWLVFISYLLSQRGLSSHEAAIMEANAMGIIGLIFLVSGIITSIWATINYGLILLPLFILVQLALILNQRFLSFMQYPLAEHIGYYTLFIIFYAGFMSKALTGVYNIYLFLFVLIAISVFWKAMHFWSSQNLSNYTKLSIRGSYRWTYWIDFKNYRSRNKERNHLNFDKTIDFWFKEKKESTFFAIFPYVLFRADNIENLKPDFPYLFLLNYFEDKSPDEKETILHYLVDNHQKNYEDFTWNRNDNFMYFMEWSLKSPIFYSFLDILLHKAVETLAALPKDIKKWRIKHIDKNKDLIALNTLIKNPAFENSDISKNAFKILNFNVAIIFTDAFFPAKKVNNLEPDFPYLFLSNYLEDKSPTQTKTVLQTLVDHWQEDYEDFIWNRNGNFMYLIEWSLKSPIFYSFLDVLLCKAIEKWSILPRELRKWRMKNIDPEKDLIALNALLKNPTFENSDILKNVSTMLNVYTIVIKHKNRLYPK